MNIMLGPYRVFPGLILAILLIPLPGQVLSAGVSTIFYGGDILTLAPGDRKPVEAVLLQDGRIVKIGLKEEIFKARSAATPLVDLRRGALLPGFIAVHTHPDLSAYLDTFVDLSGFTNRTPGQVWALLAQALKAAAPGEPVF